MRHKFKQTKGISDKLYTCTSFTPDWFRDPECCRQSLRCHDHLLTSQGLYHHVYGYHWQLWELGWQCSLNKNPCILPKDVSSKSCQWDYQMMVFSLLIINKITQGIVPKLLTSIPRIFLTPYMWQRPHTISLITVLSPGHRPPHVTMHACTSSDSKYT